ncbi:fimbrial protein [Klebsiella aerogenes]|uniref:fimbrial protein n=1 Tax=Klebsiella aerogenes TaxID=548 RepID=UPI001CC39E3D|nr:fimbrial protein [Klebsiella aerogenes]UNX72894.1 type 1 fimbrial protein [Klebsiella aerogenes]
MGKTLLILKFILLTLVNISAANAVREVGRGTVSMQGSIVETACAIEMNSREQTVDMKTVSVGQISRRGDGIPYPFKIRLINCTPQRVNPNYLPWLSFSVTFDGKHDGNLLGVEGDAEGVGLQIIDEWGNVARPGKSMPLQDIKPGNYELRYTMHLLPNNRPLRAGYFRSVVRFKMDYY